MSIPQIRLGYAFIFAETLGLMTIKAYFCRYIVKVIKKNPMGLPTHRIIQAEGVNHKDNEHCV